MKVIKKTSGDIKKKCRYCGTIFEYNKEDIIIDYRDKEFVRCPVCEKEIFI